MDSYKNLIDDEGYIEIIGFGKAHISALIKGFADKFMGQKEPPKSEKPPLSIRHQWTVAEERIKEINAAIESYTLVDRVNDIPEAWYEELAELDEYLKEKEEQEMKSDFDKRVIDHLNSLQPPKSKEPSLDITPKWILAEQRIYELNEAIRKRQDNARPYPDEWLEELRELDEYLVKRKLETKSQPPKQESKVTDQITAFKRGDDSIWRLDVDRFKSKDYTGVYDPQDILDDYVKGKYRFKIYSAKNKDGVEFTIGDLVNVVSSSVFEFGKITSFEISGNSIVAFWDRFTSNINDLVKKDGGDLSDKYFNRLVQQKVFDSVVNSVRIMQPTNQLRWKKYEWNDEMKENKLGFFLSGDHFILEQLWKDTSGGEEWRSVEVVK